MYLTFSFTICWAYFEASASLLAAAVSSWKETQDGIVKGVCVCLPVVWWGCNTMYVYTTVCGFGVSRELHAGTGSRDHTKWLLGENMRENNSGPGNKLRGQSLNGNNSYCASVVVCMQLELPSITSPLLVCLSTCLQRAHLTCVATDMSYLGVGLHCVSLVLSHRSHRHLVQCLGVPVPKSHNSRKSSLSLGAVLWFTHTERNLSFFFFRGSGKGCELSGRLSTDLVKTVCERITGWTCLSVWADMSS